AIANSCYAADSPVNKFMQIIGGVAVIAIAIVFVVSFRIGSTVKGNTGPRCAAEVHGTCIPAETFWAAYHLIAPRNAAAPAVKAMGLKRQTAEGLIEAKLLNEDAKRLGIGVSEDDVSGEIAGGRAHVSLPADKMRSIGMRLQLWDDRAQGADLIRFIPVRG